MKEQREGRSCMKRHTKNGDGENKGQKVEAERRPSSITEIKRSEGGTQEGKSR